MSLLIKALQKAEQEKTADDKTNASADGLSLELAPLQSASVEPDLAQSDLHNEAGFSEQPRVTASVKNPVQNPSSNQSLNQSQVSQQAAATMFAAKKNTPTKKAGLGNPAILGAAALLLLLLLGGGFYFYLNSFNQPELVAPQPLAATAPVNSEPGTVAETSDEFASADVATSLISPAMEEGAEAVEASEKAADKPSAIGANNAQAEQSSARSERVTPDVPPQNTSRRSEQLTFGEPIVANENAAMQVTRNKPAVGINPDLISAYAAFNAGNDAAAQHYYREVLQKDVRSVDALLGMAAIAARQGRNSDALGWYGKVLEVEPRNSIAQVAMVSVMAQADPVGSESRIKNLLAQQPEKAHLHAALGNLYAEQQQWPLAQQAYFQAMHFDAANAEYAFNLAVSLDHMGKAALALQYYKKTLELLSKSGTGNIDPAQVASRIAQLE